MLLTNFEKNVLDVTSIGGLGLVLGNYLPTVTAILTLVWMIIRIYETQTVKNLIARIRGKSNDE